MTLSLAGTHSAVAHHLPGHQTLAAAALAAAGTEPVLRLLGRCSGTLGEPTTLVAFWSATSMLSLALLPLLARLRR
eukprot:SAG31_NODE_96_length_25743_cov_56.175948_18_plen_76_part_00